MLLGRASWGASSFQRLWLSTADCIALRYSGICPALVSTRVARQLGRRFPSLVPSSVSNPALLRPVRRARASADRPWREVCDSSAPPSTYLSAICTSANLSSFVRLGGDSAQGQSVQLVMFHQLSPRWVCLGNGCAEHVAGQRFVKKFVLRLPRRFVKICKAKCDRLGLGSRVFALGHSHWTSGEMGCSRQRLSYLFAPGNISF